MSKDERILKNNSRSKSLVTFISDRMQTEREIKREMGKSREVTNDMSRKGKKKRQRGGLALTCDMLTVTPECRNEAFCKSSAAKNKPTVN